MQPDQLVLSRKDRIDLKRLRGLLVLARLRGFEDLSFWADIAMEWAEAAEAELARLRPKPGYPYIDGDALVTAAGRRYCLKHPAYELHEDTRCIRCQEIAALASIADPVWIKHLSLSCARPGPTVPGSREQRTERVFAAHLRPHLILSSTSKRHSEDGRIGSAF